MPTAMEINVPSIPTANPTISVGVSAGFASERVNTFITGIINIFLIIPGVLLIMLFGSFFHEGQPHGPVHCCEKEI